MFSGIFGGGRVLLRKISRKERKQWSRFDSVGFQSFNDPGSIKEMSKSLRLSLHGIG